MTITISTWIIPTVITIIALCLMFRPYRPSSMFDFCAIFRIFYLFPILLAWLIYFAIMFYLK